MSSGIPLRFEFVATVFLDLLGQGDKLRKLDNVRADLVGSSPTSTERLLVAANDAIGPIKYLRLIAASTAKSYTSIDRGLRDHFTIDAAQENWIERVLAEGVTNTAVGDSVFLSVRIGRGDAIEELAKLRGLFFVIAVIQYLLLKEGVLVRGGCDIGVATVDPSTNEIIGSANAKAYQLESESAKFPRVVLGDEIIELLAKCEQHVESNDPATSGITELKEVLSMVSIDQDGRTFINYLSLFMPGGNLHSGLGWMSVSGQKDQIAAQVQILRSPVESEKNCQKWQWVLSYFERLTKGMQRFPLDFNVSGPAEAD